MGLAFLWTTRCWVFANLGYELCVDDAWVWCWFGSFSLGLLWIRCYDFVGYLEIDEGFCMVAGSNDSFMVFI